MIMANGKILYHNDANKSVEYFKGIGYKCPPLTNPADYLMSLMAIDTIRDEIAE